jgi:hypothetical protein
MVTVIASSSRIQTKALEPLARFINSRDQKGMALLITLSLISMLIVLVFSLSHQGTLEAQQAHRLEQQLQQQELWNSATHAVSAFLAPMNPKKQSPPSSIEFMLSDIPFAVNFYPISDQFNLNDLREEMNSSQRKEFAASIKKAKLQPFRQTIMDLVTSSSLPWVELDDGMGSISSESEFEASEMTPWATKNFSVLPQHSVIAQLTTNDDHLRGITTLIYTQQPLKLFVRYHAQ